jgi:hypothetical protein
MNKINMDKNMVAVTIENQKGGYIYMSDLWIKKMITANTR